MTVLCQKANRYLHEMAQSSVPDFCGNGAVTMSSQTETLQTSAMAIAGEIDLAPEIRTRLRDLIDSLPDQPARLRVLGHVLLDLGLSDLALNAFGRALLIDDLDGATHLGLTRVYIQTGRRDLGLEHLEIAISLRPDARELRVLAADLLGCRDKMRALDQLGAVLASEPDHAGARKGLANLVRAVIANRLQVSAGNAGPTRPEMVSDHRCVVWGDVEPFGDLVQSSIGGKHYAS
jgi:tetratricopeptide (TPR) repeat protein